MKNEDWLASAFIALLSLWILGCLSVSMLSVQIFAKTQSVAGRSLHFPIMRFPFVE